MTKRSLSQSALSLRNKKHKELIKAYEKLSPLQQSVVQVLAVIFNETSRSNLCQCLRKLNIRDTRGIFFTVKNLDPFILEMVPSGVVEWEGSHLRCSDMLREPVSRMLLEKGGFEEIAEVVQKIIPPIERWSEEGTYPKDYEQLVRDVHIGLYRKDTDYVKGLLSDNLDQYGNEIRNVHPYVIIFKNSFDAEWLIKYLSDELLIDVLKTLSEDADNRLAPFSQDIFQLLQCRAEPMEKELRHSLSIIIAGRLILKGMIKSADNILSVLDGMEALTLKGFSAFIAGRNEESISYYNAALKLLKKTTRKRKIYFNNIPGLFFILALIRSGTPKDIQDATGYAMIAQDDNNNRFKSAYDTLVWLIRFQAGDFDYVDFIKAWQIPSFVTSAFNDFIKMFSLYWVSKKKAGTAIEFLTNFHEKSVQNGYDWLAAESAELLSRLLKGDTAYKKEALLLRKKLGIMSIVDIVKTEPRWKQALTSLINLKTGGLEGEETEKSSRLVWLFTLREKYQDWDIAPREQRKNARGVWTKGRPIALKRLHNEIETFDFLTPQDIKICSYIKEEYTSNWRGYSDVDY